MGDKAAAATAERGRDRDLNVHKRQLVACIRVFNRDRIPELVQRRASPIVVEASDDGEFWKRIFSTDPGQIFGGYSAGRPRVWSSGIPVETRYVRISIRR